MALPTKEEISSAIGRPGAVKATELEGYLPVPGIIGPESYSGGFCIVFPFVKGRDKKAVRIWHQEIDNIQERYKLLSKDTKHCQIKSLIGIEYVEAGLTVDTSDIDLTLMEWIEGKPLKNYISSIFASNRSDADKQKDIKSLADELDTIFRKMHEKGFSHGDLQHENIIITNNGCPRFIDYDCFYTPSMGASFVQTTSGYNGYQHPSRFTQQYISNEKTDYFSELILVLSLRAIANDFSIWEKTEDLDYALIFTPEDFKNLHTSPICQKIRSAGDDKCNRMLDILADYLKKESIDELEPYENIMSMSVQPEILTFEKPQNVFVGDICTLRWRVVNADTITLSGFSDILPVKGSKKIKVPSSTQYYTLVAKNGNTSVRKRLAIKGRNLPSITTFRLLGGIDKNRYVGDNVQYEWACKDADVVTINGKNCALSGFGNIALTKKDNDIRLTASSGTKYDEKSVIIKAYRPPRIHFVASKVKIDKKENVTLSWAVTSAKMCYLVAGGDRQPLEKSGDLRVTPDGTTEYKLIAVGLDDIREFSKCVTIEVKDELDTWKKALSINTIQAYQGYLDICPQGTYSKEAKERISVRKMLERDADDKDWERAIESNTKEFYQSYISKHPNGKYVHEAQRKLETFKRSRTPAIVCWIIAVCIVSAAIILNFSGSSSSTYSLPSSSSTQQAMPSNCPVKTSTLTPQEVRDLEKSTEKLITGMETAKAVGDVIHRQSKSKAYSNLRKLKDTGSSKYQSLKKRYDAL